MDKQKEGSDKPATPTDKESSDMTAAQRKEFEEWKTSCKTIGDFFARLDEINKPQIEKWKRDRERYLNNSKTWK